MEVGSESISEKTFLTPELGCCVDFDSVVVTFPREIDRANSDHSYASSNEEIADHPILKILKAREYVVRVCNLSNRCRRTKKPANRKNPESTITPCVSEDFVSITQAPVHKRAHQKQPAMFGILRQPRPSLHQNLESARTTHSIAVNPVASKPVYTCPRPVDPITNPQLQPRGCAGIATNFCDSDLCQFDSGCCVCTRSSLPAIHLT